MAREPEAVSAKHGIGSVSKIPRRIIASPKSARERQESKVMTASLVFKAADGTHLETSACPPSSAPPTTLGDRRRHCLQCPKNTRKSGRSGLAASPNAQITEFDESLLGWKEYEMEVRRDTADN